MPDACRLSRVATATTEARAYSSASSRCETCGTTVTPSGAVPRRSSSARPGATSGRSACTCSSVGDRVAGSRSRSPPMLSTIGRVGPRPRREEVLVDPEGEEPDRRAVLADEPRSGSTCPRLITQRPLMRRSTSRMRPTSCPRSTRSVTQITPVYMRSWGRVSSIRRATFSSQVTPTSTRTGPRTRRRGAARPGRAAPAGGRVPRPR